MHEPSMPEAMSSADLVKELTSNASLLLQAPGQAGHARGQAGAQEGQDDGEPLRRRRRVRLRRRASCASSPPRSPSAPRSTAVCGRARSSSPARCSSPALVTGLVGYQTPRPQPAARARAPSCRRRSHGPSTGRPERSPSPPSRRRSTRCASARSRSWPSSSAGCARAPRRPRTTIDRVKRATDVRAQIAAHPRVTIGVVVGGGDRARLRHLRRRGARARSGGR